MLDTKRAGRLNLLTKKYLLHVPILLFQGQVPANIAPFLYIAVEWVLWPFVWVWLEFFAFVWVCFSFGVLGFCLFVFRFSFFFLFFLFGLGWFFLRTAEVEIIVCYFGILNLIIVTF